MEQEDLIRFVKEARSTATDTTYRQAQGQYEKFCKDHSWEPYDARDRNFAIQLSSYARHLARDEKAPSTIKTRAAAVSSEFALQTGVAGTLADPLVRQVIKTAQTITPNKKDHSKLPLRREHLVKIAARAFQEMSDTSTGRKGGHHYVIKRDVAVILLMYFGALRVSEAIAITREQVEPMSSSPQTVQGFRIWIQRSKTNQVGREKDKEHVTVLRSAVQEICAVRWLAEYTLLAPNQEPSAPLFQTEQGKKMTQAAIRGAVKKWAEDIGLDPARYSSHSMRKGAATDANAEGASLDDIRRHGRWALGSSAVEAYVVRDEEEKQRVARTLAGQKTS